MLSSSRKSLKILVVNDDAKAVDSLNAELTDWGYDVDVARTKQDLEKQLGGSEPPDLLVLEFAFAGNCGLNLYSQIRETHSTPVLFWTAAASIESAVSATKMGAVDVLDRMADRDKLRSVIDDTLRNRNSADSSNVNGSNVNGSKVNGSKVNGSKVNSSNGQAMLGHTTAMRRLRRLIAEVAPTNANVLVLGENGTGKELVAQEIHRQSRRSAAAFVPVDVGAISPALLESTLFGYRKGAYTGAHANTKGSCEMANGGTLFLDEIGELALDLQPKLLRFLQHGVVQQLGSPIASPVDTRVIAATNRDLLDMVRHQEFREDLYFRLNVFPILVPALRDRREDIGVLAQEFVRRFARRHEKTVTAFTPAAIEMLTDYDWPGNIRELENVVERMVIRCRDDEIGAELVGPELVEPPPLNLVAPRGANSADARDGEYTWQAEGHTEIEKTQVAAIISALQKTGGNVSRAARQLGLGQATVYRKIKKYEIKREQFN